MGDNVVIGVGTIVTKDTPSKLYGCGCTCTGHQIN